MRSFLTTFGRVVLALAITLTLAGCAKSPPKKEGPPATKYALYRGYGFWFQDLTARFKKAANPPDQPPRYELVRLPDFDPLGPELAQQTAMTLSSVYPVTALSFGARASEMLQAVDVIVSNTAWVPEFARNGWLAPFDEEVLGPILREAGVEPVRVSTRGEDPASAPIYGIPITRAADFLFYRKSYFNDEAEARTAWASLFDSKIQSRVRETNEVNPKSKIAPPPFIAADGQEVHRLFLPLVWSLEPDWPVQADGTLVADTPAARRVLSALHRSMRLGAWPSAINRMSYLVDLKERVGSFTRPPRAFDPDKPSPDPATCWLLSMWAQRILITPWGPPAPLNDVGFLPLSVSANPSAAGSSLLGGKCIVCSRQLASTDPGAMEAREVVTELVRYLLSEKGQRALCADQFEIPARRDVLKGLNDASVAAVYGARREWLDVETFLTQVRERKRVIDAQCWQLGRETLALLRQIEAAMETPSRVALRSNPLSIDQSMLLDGQLHKVLKTAVRPVGRDGAGSAEPTPEEMAAARERFVEGSLRELQVRLEAQARFFGLPNSAAPSAAAAADTAAESPQAKTP